MPKVVCFALVCLLFGPVFGTPAPCQNVITTYAGTEWLFPAENRSALSAPLAGILGFGVAADNRGNFYVADADNHVVVKVAPNGILSVVAGNGIAAYSGDGGPAVNAALGLPVAVAADADGSVFIAEYGSRISRVSPDGTITTIAGKKRGFSGDGGAAVDAALNNPQGIALDQVGNIYISDSANNRIRKISTAGIITTIAGNGLYDDSGDGGPALLAGLANPRGVAVDLKGNVYVADTDNFWVRKITPEGIISVVAGGGGFGGQDGDRAIDVFIYPVGVAVDPSGNLYIADLLGSRIAKVDSAGIISTVAGNDAKGYSGDGGLATSARLNFPSSIALESNGNLYIADSAIGRIRKVDRNGIISTVAGNGEFRTGGDGNLATLAALYLPTGMAIDSQGNLYLAEPQRNRVRMVAPNGIITAGAGFTSPGDFSGDGGPAVNAHLNAPYGVAVDNTGSYFIADGLNHRIRKVSADGIVTTFAGGGNRDVLGDGGPAVNAFVFDPRYLTLDRAGNLYISEGTHRIRKVGRDGIITTVAGNGRKGYSGDGGPATSASLAEPYGVAFDSAGNLYIGDYQNNRVRKVDAAGTITTVAGNGKAEYSGDGGPATAAGLFNPAGLTVDNVGNLYIADESNARIRKVSPGGVITTIAGTRCCGFKGDGGPATNAALSVPTMVALDGAGNLYIADWANNRIRAILNRPPSFQSFPAALSFRGNAGGPAPAAQSVQLAGTVSGLRFNVATNAASADWLKATTDNGAMPATVQISADPTSLAPGSYNGTISITAPDSNPPVRTIAVTLAVDSALPPVLGAKPDALNFTLNQNSAASTQSLTVSNDGGGKLDFRAASATVSGGAWLTVSPDSGTTAAASSATLTVTANPAGLSPGVYTGGITLTNSNRPETVAVPVIMTVSAIRQTIRLPQTGLTFTAVAGGGRAPRQSFGIQNIGDGTMSWSVAASTLSGGSSWLLVSPTSGSSAASSFDAPQVDVGVDPSRLAAGEYYGRVEVIAPGAGNSPQAVSIVLNVLPAGSNPGPVVQPTGLIFTGAAGDVSPGSQTVFVSNLSGTETSFGSGRLTLDGKSWFVHLPTDATVAPDRATRIVVQPDLAGLGAGIYRGTLTLLFPGGVTRAVHLIFVVTPAEERSAKSFRNAGAACLPTKLAPLFTILPDSFEVAAGWPSPMGVRVLDDCGAPMVNGSVVASFSNGDPPLSLTPGQPGSWTGTWQARNAKSAQLTVSVKAELADHKTRGTAQVTGGLRANQSPPVIDPGAVVSAASQVPQSALAPGSLISILGSKLAETSVSAQALPLPTELAGTSVTIAGRPLPLVSVSEDRIEAILPYDIPVNTRHQLVLQRGASTAVPEPVTVASAEPAVFTKDKTGRGQGLVYAISGDGAGTLADSAAPVRVGDPILISCTGLGDVNQPVPAGTATPLSPAISAMNPVSVTIGGVPAAVSFAGLVPGSVGLYQIRTQVPPGAPAGNAVPVVVTVAGQISPPVTIAIQ